MKIKLSTLKKMIKEEIMDKRKICKHCGDYLSKDEKCSDCDSSFSWLERNPAHEDDFSDSDLYGDHPRAKTFFDDEYFEVEDSKERR